MSGAEFAHRLALAQLRDGQHLDIKADEAERAAIARRLDLLGLDRFEAAVTLTRDGDTVRAAGRLSAAATQACVATGEPVPARIDEADDLVFKPDPDASPDEEIERTGRRTLPGARPLSAKRGGRGCAARGGRAQRGAGGTLRGACGLEGEVI